jgi:hypothetical protein
MVDVDAAGITERFIFILFLPQVRYSFYHSVVLLGFFHGVRRSKRAVDPK